MQCRAVRGVGALATSVTVVVGIVLTGLVTVAPAVADPVAPVAAPVATTVAPELAPAAAIGGPGHAVRAPASAATLPSRPNELDGVSCPAGGPCVAVGYYDNGQEDQTLIETFSAGSWHPVRSPDQGPSTNVLNSVSCTSAASCMAVGYYYTGAADRALVETLSAGTWHLTPSPDQGSGTNLLNSISCTAPAPLHPGAASCVAVGYYYNGSKDQALIETLTGGVWHASASPDQGPYTNFLSGVSCPSATVCVAVGYYYTGNKDRALVESLAKGVWKLGAAADQGPSNNGLNGVACSSPTSCDAVGYYYTGSKDQTLIEKWAGSSWKVVRSIDEAPATNVLNAVECRSSRSCVAAGYYYNGANDEMVVEVLAGTTWAMVPSPDQASATNVLNAVSCSSATSCLGVGYYNNGSENRGLGEVLSSGAWSLSASAPVVTATVTSMTISVNPASIGQPVTYTAVVTPPPDGGAVDFIDDGAAIVGCDSIAIAPGTGKAVCPVTYWLGGQHVIEAAFSGDSDFGPSASGLYGNTVRLPLPGYWLAAQDGSVYGAGAAPSLGGIVTSPATGPVVGIAGPRQARATGWSPRAGWWPLSGTPRPTATCPRRAYGPRTSWRWRRPMTATVTGLLVVTAGSLLSVTPPTTAPSRPSR